MKIITRVLAAVCVLNVVITPPRIVYVPEAPQAITRKHTDEKPPNTDTNQEETMK